MDKRSQSYTGRHLPYGNGISSQSTRVDHTPP